MTMQLPLPLTREFVLIGGGHSHALLLRMWGMKPLPGVRLTVINPDARAAYSGMLPGFIAGHYQRHELELDLVRLARFAGARVVLGRVSGIDRAQKRILVPGRLPIAYDIASIDIGITSAMPGLDGFVDHATPAKPLETFANSWDSFREQVHNGRASADAVVIGGGVAGVEIAMAMAHALRRDGCAAPNIGLVDRAEVLAEMRSKTRDHLLKHLKAQGVKLREMVEVLRIEHDRVCLEGGDEIPSAFTLGAAGARPWGWLKETGLTLVDGFIEVGETLQSSNDPDIFACGDCAHMHLTPRPKAGVFAVRQAPVLYHNLVAALTGAELRSFRPQRDYLKLISLGGKSALADKSGVRLEGALLWKWKDQIDQKFMTKLKRLPAMAAVPLPDPVADGVAEALAAGKPMCGGCGAKVGSDVLAGVLAALPSVSRADVLSRAGDDAAVLLTGGQHQVFTTDHLRAFSNDPYVMARIAATHALGDIWAMGASPQAALASITLPRMSDTLQQQWLAEIMAGAGEVFSAAGAEIVGGHTSIGAELCIGFSLTGLCEKSAITVSGAQPGDRLILTKPLGSGVILAAEMALSARGHWVAEALASMARPQGEAARILSYANAMTDVTGFGLAGHLMAICTGSGLSATLHLDQLPLFEGAALLAGQGVQSTLYPKNRAALIGRCDVRPGARGDLLFDPQTAGGLLAAVPSADSAALVRALTEAGIDAVEIGELHPGAPFITAQ
jgi:selenide, water dikinase